MKRREDNNLLQALEAAVAECRRLENRIQELEEELRVKEQNEFFDEEKQRYNNRPKRQRKGGRTYRPWQKKEEPSQVDIQIAHRRSVDDIYREQKHKHEEKVVKAAAAALEQERIADEAYAAAEKNKPPVDVRFSDAKKQLLIETGKTIMNGTGN